MLLLLVLLLVLFSSSATVYHILPSRDLRDQTKFINQRVNRKKLLDSYYIFIVAISSRNFLYKVMVVVVVVVVVVAADSVSLSHLDSETRFYAK